eukprot:TRINITY_DN3474_c0_g1_i1.p1 TRINITY_DN3474_c0_g1~~TRINITY_DN3474_c0_g1_i1.p1  ORF type:complete len:896 (+),score=368.09 TRINITY_DN3474_c0_g1_i1:73-2760(+)
MSRFWGDSESDSEQSLSDNEQNEDVGRSRSAPASKVASFVYDESSDSDTEKRVIKSEKDKKFEALRKTVKDIKNHIKISDWNSIRRDFDVMNEQIDKAANIIKKEGIPIFYFKALNSIESFLQKSLLNKKDLSSSNAKSLNIMKQKLKKQIKQYQEQYDKFMQSPAAQETSDLEEDDLDRDSDEESGDDSDRPKKGRKGKMASDEESDEEDDFEAESDSDSDSDIDLAAGKFTREFWLKKPEDDEDEELRENKKRERRLLRQQQKIDAAATAEDTPTSESKQREAVELTPRMIRDKLKEILAIRGKRGTDRLAVVEDLKMLASASSEPALSLRIKIILVSALFDLNLNTHEPMKVEHWKSAHSEIMDIVTELKRSPNVRLSEDEIVDSTAFEEEEDDESKPKGLMAAAAAAADRDNQEDKEEKGDRVEYVAGNLFAFVTRLSEEFIRSLQNTDPHTQDYLVRMRDEASLEELIARVREYYNQTGNIRSEALMTLLGLEYAYYKYDPAQDVQRQSSEQKEDSTRMFGPKPLLRPEDHLVHKSATFIYQHGDQRSKTRALLCHVYWYARHNRFFEARDLFLMSHVQDNIQLSDISTKILFNRTTAQLGLCSFRVGQIKTAFTCLADLYLTIHIKKLLAQGLSVAKYEERNPEQEKQERQRQMPYHMHINVDMLDAVHAICAMLLEVPNMAIHPDDKRHVISIKFRRWLEIHIRQIFTGPPENTRDFIMSGAMALMQGDWKRCVQHVMGLKMWAFMPNAEIVKPLITRKIQEEGLRTYLLTFSSRYASIDLNTFAQMFELDKRSVHSLVSRMIVNEELAASWDGPSECIILHGTEPSPLQQMALRYADKLAIFVDQNERLLEQRSGAFFNKLDKRTRMSNQQHRSGSSNLRSGSGNRL